MATEIDASDELHGLAEERRLRGGVPDVSDTLEESDDGLVYKAISFETFNATMDGLLSGRRFSRRNPFLLADVSYRHRNNADAKEAYANLGLAGVVETGDHVTIDTLPYFGLPTDPRAFGSNVRVGSGKMYYEADFPRCALFTDYDSVYVYGDRLGFLNDFFISQVPNTSNLVKSSVGIKLKIPQKRGGRTVSAPHAARSHIDFSVHYRFQST